MKYEAIVMGASAGGLNAFSEILSQIPSDYTLPIIIVQHLSPDSNSFLAEHINKICALNVVEALDKMAIETGHVYVSPPGYHMLIEPNKTISLSLDPPINYSRPSIDLLFETASETYKEALICILMTGANNDGSSGMKKAYDMGGACIVQNPKTSENPTMPQSALDLGIKANVLSLKEIATFLLNVDSDV